MYAPFGYGGGMFFSSNYLILVGIPLLIAMWAQFRVSGAFKTWGAVRASSNITGAEAAREILQAANIADVNVVASTTDDQNPKRGSSINVIRYGVPTQTTPQK